MRPYIWYWTILVGNFAASKKLTKMKHLKLIAAICMALVFAFPAWSDTKGSEQSEPKPNVVPIILHKTKNTPRNVAPSRGVEAYITMEESGTVGFILPFESYPADVTISGEGTTMGCWTSTLAGAADVMPFDGGEGDYRLEISTPDGSYVGYFTLE